MENKSVVLAVPSSTGNIPCALYTQLMLCWKPKKYLPLCLSRVLIDDARNAFLNYLLENPDWEYLWFVDDDTDLDDPYTLKKMLDLDKDIVICPMVSRKGDGRPNVFDKELQPVFGIKEPTQISWGGMACTLIHRRVLEAMGKKYKYPFEFVKGKFDGKSMNVSEDMMFCRRATEEGFEVWAVPVYPGHVGNPAIYRYSPDAKPDKKLEDMFNAK